MTVRIQPPAGNSQETTRIAKLLLEAAGDNPHAVETITDGPSVAFLVPEDIAKKVQLDPDTGEQAATSGGDDKKKTSKKGNA